MTLGDWLAASGSGNYTLRGNRADVSMELENLVPNGLYTVWCTRIGLPPEFDMVNKACGPADGSENAFHADSDGNATFDMSTWALAPTDEAVVSVIALAYHSDGNTYGDSPGTFGQNSHVQLFTILPPPGHEAWMVVDGG